jgi:hypothetical protein
MDRELLGIEWFDLETRFLKLKGFHFLCGVLRGCFQVSCFIAGWASICGQADFAINNLFRL